MSAVVQDYRAKNECRAVDLVNFFGVRWQSYRSCWLPVCLSPEQLVGGSSSEDYTELEDWRSDRIDRPNAFQTTCVGSSLRLLLCFHTRLLLRAPKYNTTMTTQFLLPLIIPDFDRIFPKPYFLSPCRHLRQHNSDVRANAVQRFSQAPPKLLAADTDIHKRVRATSFLSAPPSSARKKSKTKGSYIYACYGNIFAHRWPSSHVSFVFFV